MQLFLWHFPLPITIIYHYLKLTLESTRLSRNVKIAVASIATDPKCKTVFVMHPVHNLKLKDHLPANRNCQSNWYSHSGEDN